MGVLFGVTLAAGVWIHDINLFIYPLFQVILYGLLVTQGYLFQRFTIGFPQGACLPFILVDDPTRRSGARDLGTERS